MQLTCDSVTLAYEGRAVVKNLSFTVEQGDYLCILGENGSGKSTLVKALLGLKKPHNGTISFSADKKHAKIGYLPQQTPLQKDFPASVREVVLSGGLNERRFLPLYSKAMKARAASVLKQLGMENVSQKSYRALSGGQQQRVLLARALCAAEDMLLLDEPVTGLDPMASRDMYEMIAQIHARGTTVIMVSHDIKHAVQYATHILHLHEGHSFFGTRESYTESVAYRSFKGGKMHD